MKQMTKPYENRRKGRNRMRKSIIIVLLMAATVIMSSCIIFEPMDGYETETTENITPVPESETSEKSDPPAPAPQDTAEATATAELTPTAEPTPSPTPAPVAFSQQDAHIGSLQIGQATLGDTLAVITEAPASVDSVTWGATGEDVDTYTYSFGELMFVDNILKQVTITNNTISGPRGFGVGDDINDVIASFASTHELQNSNLTIYYRNNTGDSEMMAIPPAAVYYTDATYYLALSCFADSENLTGLSYWELVDMYTYTPYYYCAFRCDTNGVVTSLYISYLASAE